jgi:hypothetical protein
MESHFFMGIPGYPKILCISANEEPTERGTASIVTKFLRLFSVHSCPKIIHLFLVGVYQNLFHHASNVKLLISHQFLQGRWCFLLDKLSRKMFTIFSAVLRQQRKSDVMTSFGHSARSAILARSPLQTNIDDKLTLWYSPLKDDFLPFYAKFVRKYLIHSIENYCIIFPCTLCTILSVRMLSKI